MKEVKSLKGILKANEKGGIKDDAEKLLWSLLPFDALESTIKVLMHGAKKYSPDNWRKVEKERYVDALLRHIIAFLNGEAIDPDSGQSHLAHATCCILFLNSLYKDQPFKHKSKEA